MSDLFHIFGEDLAISVSGDIAQVSGAEMSRQRVLRRLLTNPGELLLSPEYGAGLGRFVGEVVQPDQISAVIRQQMLLESAVSQNPGPTISVVQSVAGEITATISYTDVNSGSTQQIGLSVSNMTGS